MKPKILITSLTSCSGCVSTIISLDIFPQLMERTELVYFPFISDGKDINKCDIAIIEGCVSEESQETLLKHIRKQATNVYALGTCAAFGGVLSLSKKINSYPLSHFIEIDGIIPGCPIPQKLSGNCLMKIIENKEFEIPEKNLCSGCPLRDTSDLNYRIPINKFCPDNDEITDDLDQSECFLKRGILCLGPITRDGCEQNCINYGIPCEGCMGPLEKDYTANLVNFLSLVSLPKDLRKYKGIYYRFSKPSARRRY